MITMLNNQILFLKSNLGIVQDGKVKGAPDLVSKILSIDKNYDLKTKKIIYEKFGVKEYFVINQFTKEVITFYYNGSNYNLQASKEGILKSKLLKKTCSF